MTYKPVSVTLNMIEVVDFIYIHLLIIVVCCHPPSSLTTNVLNRICGLSMRNYRLIFCHNLKQP